ncbi:ATP-binding protein [Hydromonas duriensis]|uniref:histidine kinase n=1 Tax=Hydromonas duriensis TaxID=1527608 RepID=A0A4R6Y7I7_9BURK|nr:ATP-binding protein [Hydromonas duriensis]TDR31294.1 nitrogen fixation/metabolism regulation signal transduction histidine kinase [Hydromonas duriensis]
MNKYLKSFFIGTMALGTGLLVALALATRSSSNFQEQYSILLALNVGTIIVMLTLLGFLAVWLWRRLRQNVFGTRLLTRFALSFALLGIIPSILLFLISTMFVSRTIDTWFNLKLDTALEAGLNFGREGLSRASEQTRDNLERVSLELQGQNADQASSLHIDSWLKTYRWQAMAAFDKQGKPLWQNSDGSQLDNHVLSGITPEMMAKSQEGWTWVEDESDAQDGENVPLPPVIHAIKEIPKATGQAHYLYAQRVMPINFAKKVLDIQNGLRDYQATESSRTSLRNLYRVTLSVTLLLTMLAALAAAFLIANRMIQPILWLAQATRMVATGHYALVPQRVKGSDELIQLVDSFGDMAQQLNVTQLSLQHNQKELEAAKAYSEAVLDNLSSGVLVFNHDFMLESFNRSANRMFQTDLTPCVGQYMAQIDVLAPLFEPIQEAMRNHANHATDSNNWRIQQNLTFNRAQHTDDLTVSVQGSRFIAEDGEDSIVLVCDDISPIVSAQRTLAWGEVARRLAHEIKNPLTPIQLSAERLNMKLHDKLEEADQYLLERSTRTIVNQVMALQNMADEFRNYARAPEIAFSALDLNELLREILTLYEAGEGVKYRIHADLAESLPLILADAQQLRQVLHNLIKNAIEAHETGVLPVVELSTNKVELQSDSLIHSQAVGFSIRDYGTGFSPKILARMFEPYNTTKSGGTGLGLPVVKKIIDAHHGKITVKNHTKNDGQNEILGAQIDILFLNVLQTDNSNFGVNDTPRLI